MTLSLPRTHGPAIHALRIALAAAGIAGLIAAFNYAVDPLQIFHRPWFYPARYTSDPRLGNAGLIESQRFDTAFMGTSFSYAIRQSEIDDALGGKSLKLAMAGGTSKEQLVVLSAALRKQPQRIVWQMDDYMFRDSGDVDAYLKSDLYRRDVAGLSGYLFDLGTGREALWIVLVLSGPPIIVASAVGLIMAIIQAVTQIQEQTLVFVPKILAIFVTMLIALPFMGATMSGFMTRLADMIVTGG